MIRPPSSLDAVQFAQPAWLAALWALPGLVLLVLWGLWRRRRRLNALADRDLRRELGAAGMGPGLLLRAALAIAALGLFAVALARPQWDARERTVSREGRDVVFVIDVSRSMLAEDIVPNRLERTKLWLRDVAQTLDGDRVGLVAFAGTSVVKCPLTLDYAYFDLVVRELNPDSVGRGGTRIGDALRRATDTVFDHFEGRYRDVILITDGEDQDSAPIEAARAAAASGIRLIAVGLGNDGAGSRIPREDGAGFVVDRAGREVRSRLDRDTLEAMARTTPGGVYLHVGTGTIELDRVYQDLVKSAAGNVVEQQTIVEYDEGFQLFLLAGIILLLLEGLLGVP